MINRIQSDVFVLKGFNNWKIALEKKKGLRLHETTLAHLTATSNYKEFVIRKKSKLTVINVADQGKAEQIRKNRERLIKIASAILLCARQMIALRSHYEHEELVFKKFTSRIIYFFFVLDQTIEEIF
jgi:hypothetical protein